MDDYDRRLMLHCRSHPAHTIWLMQHEDVVELAVDEEALVEDAETEVGAVADHAEAGARTTRRNGARPVNMP